MRFTVEIELGNDAMRTPEDIATALRQVASKVESGYVRAGYGNALIRDTNGNTVGTCAITDD